MTTSSLVQAEHSGALAVYPAAELAATTLRRAAGIWWHYATAGKVRPQDVDDHVQSTMAEWWRRTDGEALSRPRAAALLRYAIAATWSAIIDGRDPATNAVLPDYASKPVPTEYLACRSRPCDLVAAVQAADDRRAARQQDLLARAAAGLDHHDPPGLSPVLPSDHVQTLRQSLRIVDTEAGVSCGVPGTLRCAWHTADDRCPPSYRHRVWQCCPACRQCSPPIGLACCPACCSQCVTIPRSTEP